MGHPGQTDSRAQPKENEGLLGRGDRPTARKAWSSARFLRSLDQTGEELTEHAPVRCRKIDSG